MKSFKEYLFLKENTPLNGRPMGGADEWNSLAAFPSSMVPIHDLIKQFIFKHHAERYPHIGHDVEASKEHIGRILDSHPDAPFYVNDIKKAIEAIHPHAIEGNSNVENLIYDKYPDETMGGDITELPSGVYDDLVTRNEDGHADDLHKKVEADLRKYLLADDPDLQ